VARVSKEIERNIGNLFLYDKARLTTVGSPLNNRRSCQRSSAAADASCASGGLHLGCFIFTQQRQHDACDNTAAVHEQGTSVRLM